MAETARQAGFGEVIGFDMGGTSTDVCHYAGSYERDSETEFQAFGLRVPMLIHTVAAGGGSICRIDAGRLVVGPESAGRCRGQWQLPARRPLTVTDCNVLLGRSSRSIFPRCSGPDGDQPLDAGAVRDGSPGCWPGRLASADPGGGRRGVPRHTVANMANAIKAVSVRRGHDAARRREACFGGAGGQHACLVAGKAGDRAGDDPSAGGGAFGLWHGAGRTSALRERTVAPPLDAGHRAALADAWTLLGPRPRRDLRAQGVTAARPRGGGRAAPCRDRDADRSGMGRGGDGRGLATAQPRALRFRRTSPLVAETVRVEAVARASAAARVRLPLPEQLPPAATVRAYMGGAWRAVPLWRRGDLAAGFAADGLAIISDPVSTTVVDPAGGSRWTQSAT